MGKDSAQRLAIIGTVFGATFAGASSAAAEATDAPTFGEPIIVTGYRLPDPLLDDVQPIDELGPSDVAAYGVGSISELLADLTRELGAGGDSAPLVLLNGRRIASIAEVTDLPTESVQRVDILPAPAALRFGGNGVQRTINLVLRAQFRSTTVNGGAGLATEGGGRNGNMAVALTRVIGDDRLSLSAQAYTGERLLESQRDIAQPGGSLSDEARFRTLKPEQHLYSLKGTFARELRDTVKFSVTAGGNYETRRSLNGLADPDDLAAGVLPGNPLRQNVRNVGGFVDLAGNADVGRWSLSATAGYGQRRTRTLTDRQLGDPDLAGALIDDRVTDRADSRSTTAGLTFVATGALLELPAGDLRLSLTTDLSRSSLAATVRNAQTVNSGQRGRTDAGAWLGAEVPITRQGNGAGFLGGLTANFKAGIRSVSDMSKLHSFGAGLSWRPARAVSFNASLKDDRQPPSLVQLASPVIETSGIRAFDYLLGETAELTQVGGGNPDLGSEHRRTLTVGINLLPFGPNSVRISADYKKLRVDDLIAALPAATADIQAAFPDRFVRDFLGALVRIDDRLVNFDRRDLEQLHWGISWRRGGAGSDRGNGEEGDDGGTGLGLRLSLDHTVVLKDDVLLRRGFRALDLLNGDAIGAYGGQPRHILQWELGATRDGLGARLLGSWRSGSTVRGGGDDDTGLLRFSPLMQHELRLFADLGSRLPRFSWAHGSRLTLTVTNLFDQKQKVRDSNGETPLIYQPDYLDPLGRTVRLSLRKILD